MSELLSLIADDVRQTWLQLMCCAPFLNICVPNLTKGQGQRFGRGGWSWVGGAILEMDKSELSQGTVRMKIGED